MLLPDFPYGTGVGIEDGRNENVSLLKGSGRDDRNEGGEEKEECSHERGRHHREKCGEEGQQTKKTKQKVRVCRMGTGGDGQGAGGEVGGDDDDAGSWGWSGSGGGRGEGVKRR